MLRTLFAALVLVAVLFFQVTPALASCTQQVLSHNGRLVTCTTCCLGSSCTTTCM